jgi:hypothetical protein
VILTVTHTRLCGPVAVFRLRESSARGNVKAFEDRVDSVATATLDNGVGGGVGLFDDVIGCRTREPCVTRRKLAPIVQMPFFLSNLSGLRTFDAAMGVGAFCA